MQQPFDESLKEVAGSMGISVYHQFSMQEASIFLRCPVSNLEELIRKNKISYIQVSKNEVYFFGYQLLQHLLKSVVPENQQTKSRQFYDNQDRILRSEEVEELVGLARTTIWRMERRGEFPARLQLTARRVGWRLSEINNWLTNL